MNSWLGLVLAVLALAAAANAKPTSQKKELTSDLKNLLRVLETALSRQGEPEGPPPKEVIGAVIEEFVKKQLEENWDDIQDAVEANIADLLGESEAVDLEAFKDEGAAAVGDVCIERAQKKLARFGKVSFTRDDDEERQWAGFIAAIATINAVHDAREAAGEVLDCSDMPDFDREEFEEAVEEAEAEGLDLREGGDMKPPPKEVAEKIIRGAMCIFSEIRSNADLLDELC